MITHLVARAQLQRHSLSNRGRCPIGTSLTAFLLSKLRPCFPLSNAVIYQGLLQGSLNPARNLQIDMMVHSLSHEKRKPAFDTHLDFLALIIKNILYSRPYAIFVGVVLALWLFCSKRWRP